MQQSNHANKTVESSSVHGCSFSKNEGQCTSAFKFQEPKAVRSGNPQAIPEQEMSLVLDHNINQRNNRNASVITKADDSSVLNIQSLNLSGCTVTQQRLFAQEALDCTKALLEDEDDLSLTVENMPLQVESQTSSSSAEEVGGRSKRVLGDPDQMSKCLLIYKSTFNIFFIMTQLFLVFETLEGQIVLHW